MNISLIKLNNDSVIYQIAALRQKFKFLLAELPVGSRIIYRYWCVLNAYISDRSLRV